MLQALANSSVVTDPTKLQIVNNGGPADIQALVLGLGQISSSKTAFTAMLSSGVQLISKPSNLNVPPWQMAFSFQLLDSKGNPLVGPANVTFQPCQTNFASCAESNIPQSLNSNSFAIGSGTYNLQASYSDHTDGINTYTTTGSQVTWTIQYPSLTLTK
jgi:hypothetical protein